MMRVCALAVLFVVLSFSFVGGAVDFPYTVAWDIESESGFSAPNAIYDMASGRVNTFVVADRDKGVTCISLQGQVLWRYPMTPPVTAAPAVADVDGDGVEDVVAADSVGHLVVLKADGTLLWSAVAPGGVAAESCPAVAQLTDLHEVQILVGDTSGTLSCFGAPRDLRWQFTGDGPNPTGDFFSSVYTGRDGPVTSKRWEVAREGVEDYELLYLLKDAVAQAEQKGVASDKIAQARDVLETIPAKTEDVLYKVGRRIELTPDSVPAYEAATQALKAARARIIQAYLDIR